MVASAARPLLTAVLALALANSAAGAEPPVARLFGTVDEALAVVRTFGPDWQAPQQEEVIPSGVDGIRAHRFRFGPHQYVTIGTDAKGIVRQFDVADFEPVGPADRTHPIKCSALSDHARLATLLLEAAEPNHGPPDVNLMTSAAGLGWTPVLGLFSVQVNTTVLTFLSGGDRCAAKVRELEPSPVT